MFLFKYLTINPRFKACCTAPSKSINIDRFIYAQGPPSMQLNGLDENLSSEMYIIDDRYMNRKHRKQENRIGSIDVNQPMCLQ